MQQLKVHVTLLCGQIKGIFRATYHSAIPVQYKKNNATGIHYNDTTKHKPW